MAQRQLNMGLTLVLIVTMWADSFAQPSCPPPMVSLQPCLGFITGNSSSTPPPQCCTQLASMVQSQAQCLCQLLNLAPQLPLPINRTQAVTLPGACNIQAPPLSQCNAQSGPSTSTTPSGPFIPAAGSPQGAPSPASPATTPDATPPSSATPAPATPSAPSGISPPSDSTPSTKGVPPAPGGSKADNKGQASSSIRNSAVFPPSLFFFLLVALGFSGF